MSANTADALLQPDFAQDPDELFDVLNEDGSATGFVKRRADVHRDGDWHRAIHIWIFGVYDRVPHLLLNLRSDQKDTWPGRLDVTVGGHLGAGESPHDAWREVREEIGIEIEPALLLPIGQRRAYGQIEREIQDVYLYRDDRRLDAYLPNPAELAGLVAVSTRDAVRVFTGASSFATGVFLSAATRQMGEFTVSAANLLPARHYPYYQWAAQSADALTHGLDSEELRPPPNDAPL